MGWPKQLVLVRHAESEGNVKTVDERAGFCLSTHSYGLTEKGKKQAELTGKYLKDQFGLFDVNYVSYYQRARDTMKLMYPGVKVYEDPRLAEAQRGIYHVMTRDELACTYPIELIRKDREGLYHYRPWGGENWPDVELRIHSFLGTLSRDCEGQRVLVVVHGHWLILLQRLIEHFSIEEAMARYDKGVVKNASVTSYNCDNRNGKSRLVLGISNLAPWEGKIT
jgi:probable phosphoglycerate mutase